MKYSLFLIALLFLLGCRKSGRIIDIDFPPPPPPPSLIPPPPPNFTPTKDVILNIQVNPIPHPFNLNGSIPYAVWVNGKRLPMNGNSSRNIAKALGLEFSQPKNTAKIHNGEGWLYPLDIKEKSP